MANDLLIAYLFMFIDSIINLPYAIYSSISLHKSF